MARRVKDNIVFRFLLLGVLSVATVLITCAFSAPNAQAAVKPSTPIGTILIFPDGHKVTSYKKVSRVARPMAAGQCISAGGSGAVTYQDSNWLDFNATTWIENDCTGTLGSGASWEVEIYASCSGQMFDTGGNSGSLASPTSPGELVPVESGYPYRTTCIYADFTQRAPDYDEVQITASGNVTGSGFATGFGSYYV